MLFPFGSVYVHRNNILNFLKKTTNLMIVNMMGTNQAKKQRHFSYHIVLRSYFFYRAAFMQGGLIQERNVPLPACLPNA